MLCSKNYITYEAMFKSILIMIIIMINIIVIIEVLSIQTLVN